MTKHSIGLMMVGLGVVFFWVRGWIQERMQHVVAKLAPPKTNRPLKNLLEALDSSRVRKEYERLFPERARRKFLAMRICTIAGAVCILLGIYLAR